MTNLLRTIFVLVALTISCYIGVDLFYVVLTEKIRPASSEEISVQTTQEARTAVKPPLHHFKTISEKNMFGIAEKGQREAEKEPVVEEIVPTRLDVALLGTGAVSDQESAVAVIRDTVQKKQDFYRVGDTIQGALVKKILRGKVIVRVGNRDEVLTMEKEPLPAGGKEAPPSRQPPEDRSAVQLSRSQMEESMGNINQLLSQARIRPSFRDGRPDGLSITQISKGSFFQRLGLRDGDVLQSVNGSPVKSPDDIMAFYQKLRSAPRVSLMIRRGGQQRTMDYNFDK